MLILTYTKIPMSSLSATTTQVAYLRCSFSGLGSGGLQNSLKIMAEAGEIPAVYGSSCDYYPQSIANRP